MADGVEMSGGRFRDCFGLRATGSWRPSTHRAGLISLPTPETSVEFAKPGNALLQESIEGQAGNNLDGSTATGLGWAGDVSEQVPE
jgi:hypothetical protein